MNAQRLDSSPCEATCPACGYHVAVRFLDGGAQPLATLGWPKTAQAARAMPRLPADFVRCVECGHVYNPAFDYSQVPYVHKPNLMFNCGALWSDFVRDTVRQILRRLPERPVVVEIGHGDASLLAALAAERPSGRYVGFDPHGTTCGRRGVELRAELFDPCEHLEQLMPDIVISRHVLEHLTSPLAFLQRIAFASARLGRRQQAYFEVPCIDRALATARTVDFYYEHNSQFTTGSFTRMLSQCTAQVDEIGYGYDGEVIYAHASLGTDRRQVETAEAARRFRCFARASTGRVRGELEELRGSGARIVIWGGTGKSAAFINRYDLDAVRFPIVVDSDPAKVGTFVPGTGQEIRPPEWLKKYPADIVIIPPQWRAQDIVGEMQRMGIRVGCVLIEHRGALIDYFRDSHPYQGPSLRKERNADLYHGSSTAVPGV